MESVLRLRHLAAPPHEGALPTGIYYYENLDSDVPQLYLVGPRGEVLQWNMPRQFAELLQMQTQQPSNPPPSELPWNRIYELLAIGANPALAYEILYRRNIEFRPQHPTTTAPPPLRAGVRRPEQDAQMTATEFQIGASRGSNGR